MTFFSELNQNSNYPIIKCPYCGYNYVPAEIMMPDDFLGKPENIVRDALGKILYHDYPEDSQPSQSTTFTCEG